MKLYICGNGFDLHHGLPTSYTEYKDFLNKKYPNTSHQYEYIVSNYPKEIKNWWNIEEALRIDYQKLLYDIRDNLSLNGVDDLLGIIRFITNFTGDYLLEWFSTINVDLAKPDLDLKPEDLYINFNYTSTLESIYHIPENRILYIHGSLKPLEHPSLSEKLYLSESDFLDSEDFKTGINLSFKGLYSTEDSFPPFGSPRGYTWSKYDNPKSDNYMYKDVSPTMHEYNDTYDLEDYSPKLFETYDTYFSEDDSPKLVDLDNTVFSKGEVDEIRSYSVRSELQFGTVIDRINTMNMISDWLDDNIDNGLVQNDISIQLFDFMDKSTKQPKTNYNKLRAFIKKQRHEIDSIVVMGHTLGSIDFQYYKDVIVPLCRVKNWVFKYYNEDDLLMINDFINKTGLRFTEIEKW